MSSELALAATLRAIARLIDAAVAGANLAVFQGSEVSSLSPELVEGGTAAASKPQLNLFPYFVSMNPGWSREFLPARDAVGASIERPPLAVDAHLVLSAHATQSYQAEALLGIAMRALHDEPTLSRDRITDLLAPPANNNDALIAALANARLADQFERVKILPLNLNPADMQGLWQSLHARYRPSYAYSVSTMLIDSRLNPRAGLPVKSYNSVVLPFLHPEITAVDPPQAQHDPAGRTIALIGTDLAQPDTIVRFQSGETAPLAVGSTATRALVALPPALPAGLVGIDVARMVAIGAAPPKQVNPSNTVVFIHRPIIRRTPANAPDITVLPPAAGAPRRVAVRLAPVPGTGQKVELLLNRLGDLTGDGHLVEAVPATPPPDPVVFAVPDVPAGQWVLRVRVAGAETELESDAAGAFAGPLVTLP